MRPYVICHMMPSVDGRLRTDRWGMPESTYEVYERTGASHRADAWMCGRTTMEEFAKGRGKPRASGTGKVPRTDFVVPREKGESYAVAIDRHGKLAWSGRDVDGDPLVSVLTEQVPDSYLRFLRDKGISYLFAGKRADDLDLVRALDTLRRKFGVWKVLLEGGGGINGAFLRAGLVDELSLLLTPVVDGGPGEPALADVEEVATARAVARLRLRSVRRAAPDVLWIRYAVRARGRAR